MKYLTENKNLNFKNALIKKQKKIVNSINDFLN